MSTINLPSAAILDGQQQAARPSALFKRASFAAGPNILNQESSGHIIGDSPSQLSTRSMRIRFSTYSLEDVCCTCLKGKNKSKSKIELDPKLLEEKLKEREEQLREEFKETMEKEITYLKDRFDFILQNEQARASCMLREAHRERKEKITALQQQLECKNMAGLMYVMCAERTKCKVEKMQIIETYTRYINMLNDILVDGQELILNLSRGYKTAARVDHEWKEKMKAIICQFKTFICHFSGTPAEQNQYLIDLPKLLEIEAPKEDDPNEDPIEEDPPEPVDPDDLDANKEWWQLLDEENRPFAVYGDMSDFKPPQRREALKRVKAAKTAPRKWKEYMFHDMFLKSDCPNAEIMKREYFNRIPETAWDCNAPSSTWDSKAASRRQTTQSIDMRGNMGSILKIILLVLHTEAYWQQAAQNRDEWRTIVSEAKIHFGSLSQRSNTTTGLADPVTKANLLGARDSMEIASSTRVREKSKSIMDPWTNKIEIKVGGRRTSFYEDDMKLDTVEEVKEAKERPSQIMDMSRRSSRKYNEEEESIPAGLNKEPTDSLTVIAKHVPERDHVINYEKFCPMPTCQRRRADSFMHSLPRYMRASPYTHFEETFDDYETCSPEQLAILKQRIDEKKKKERGERGEVEFDPLLEWKDSVGGIGVQTSDLSYLDVGLPPCTCRDPVPTPESGPGVIYRLEDLIPLKQNLDKITKECLFSDQIQFERFKVIGQESSESLQAKTQLNKIKQDFTRERLREIQNILKAHPSLLDIFQANNRC